MHNRKTARRDDSPVSEVLAKLGNPPKTRSIGKGLVSGIAAGFVGTIAMTQFQTAWGKASKAIHGNGSQAQDSDQHDRTKNASEDSTMRTAGKLAHLAGRELSHEQKVKGGPIVHYGFGTMMGALYGMGMEVAPESMRVKKLPYRALGFGSALFVGADEIALPALGLAGKVTETPPSSHLYGYASHLVYGFAAELVRKGVRRLL